MTTTSFDNIRTRTWERKFPGCTHDFQTLFGEDLPTPKTVAEWKNSWNESSPHVFEISYTRMVDLDGGAMRSDVYAITERLGIHPYFWEFSKRRTEIPSALRAMTTVVVTPIVTFFYEEHLVMFKLAW